MPRAASARNLDALILREDINTSLKNALAPPKLPDIVTFAENEHFCNKKLYPRQKTLLRLFYGDIENMTDYDYHVIDEWRNNFYIGNERVGCAPDIWERLKWLKENDYPHFREIEFIGGRRGGKGHLGGIVGAYQAFKLITLDNPQWYYGIDPNKDLYCLITATNQSQARDYQFKDIAETVTYAKCFERYISTNKGLWLSLRTPADIRRIAQHEKRGVPVEREVASLRFVALSSNSRAGRGAATFCLDPETPVLLSDLRWIPVKDLVPGHQVVGIDEFGKKKYTHRKLRDATVEAVKKTRGLARRITFDDDSSITCSLNHRWMLERKSASHAPVWREAGNFKVGDRIRSLADPWEEDKSWEGGYLAGFYDGEGCVVAPGKNHHGDLLVSQNPGKTLDTVLGMLRAKGFEPIRYSGEEYHEGKLCEQWAITGVREKMRFLGSIRPNRLIEKSNWVWEGYTLRALNGTKSYKTITSIEELPEQELIDIQTSSGTFIANGLISHNSLFFDEMAHMLSGTEGPQTAEEVYKALTPSLDQMGKDALIYIPTSPYSKVGAAYSIYEDALKTDEDGKPENPDLLMVQMPSWSPYEDWNDPLIVAPGTFRTAPQVLDEQAKRLEERDPESFKVERRAQWAEVINAYLNPKMVDRIFEDIKTGEDGVRHLDNYTPGVMRWVYRGHVDPSASQANFAVAIGHCEPFRELIIDEETGDTEEMVINHVIFDWLQVWKPEDFPDHQIDYIEVEKELVDIITKFRSLKSVSYDQYGGFVTVPYLKAHLRKVKHEARVHQVTFTPKSNHTRAERFKSALGMGWVHAPRDKYGPDNKSLLELELKFLQNKNGRIDKQAIGPVTTKDLSDTVMEVTSELLADQIDRIERNRALANSRIALGAQGGYHTGMDNSPQPGSARDKLRNVGRERLRKQQYGI